MIYDAMNGIIKHLVFIVIFHFDHKVTCIDLLSKVFLFRVDLSMFVNFKLHQVQNQVLVLRPRGWKSPQAVL